MTYCALAEVRDWVAFGDSADDAELSAALASAGRAIDTYCGQTFEPDGTTSARLFFASCSTSVDLAARRSVIGTSTGLVVKTDDNDNGTFETTWSASDYYSLPLSGVGADGRTGWPITAIVSTGTRSFPVGGVRPQVQITANWGWASTPDSVKLACRMLTVAWHQRRATVAGQGGFENFFSSAIRDDVSVQDLLDPYRVGTAVTGFG